MSYDLQECSRCEFFRHGRCTWHDVSRPKVVAVDLDGTILRFDGWKGQKHFGEPLPGAKEALFELKRRGFIVVIWTTRKNIEDIKRVLAKYGIPFDYINENPHQPPDCGGKIYADFYVDDRAVEFNGNWDTVLRKILQR